jgi:hypothetical protein
MSVHHEGLRNQPKVGKDGMEEHLSLGSVAIEDSQGFSGRTNFAVGVRVEKSGPTAGAGVAGLGAGSGVFWLLCSKQRSAASMLTRAPLMVVNLALGSEARCRT